MTQTEIDRLRRQPVPAGRLFIGGAFRPGIEGAMLDVISPIDGRVFTQIVAGSASDVDAAVAAGRRSFEAGKWSRTAPGERKRVLLRLADWTEWSSGGATSAYDLGLAYRLSQLRPQIFS